MTVNLTRFLAPQKTAGLGGTIRRLMAAGTPRAKIEGVLRAGGGNTPAAAQGLNRLRFGTTRGGGGLGGEVRRATEVGVGREGIERILRQNHDPAAASAALQSLVKDTGRAPLPTATAPPLGQRLQAFKATKPAPDPHVPTFLDRMADEAAQSPAILPRSKAPQLALGGAAALTGGAAALSAGVPGQVSDAASAVAAIPGRVSQQLGELKTLGAGTPTPQPPQPSLPTAAQGNPLWQYLPHAGLAAAGGLGLYALYQNEKKKEEQSRQPQLVNMLPKTAADQAAFVDAHPFVAGFLVACHDAGLDECQIAEKIAIACRIDVEFAEVFRDALVKEGAGPAYSTGTGPMPAMGPAPSGLGRAKPFTMPKPTVPPGTTYSASGGNVTGVSRPTPQVSPGMQAAQQGASPNYFTRLWNGAQGLIGSAAGGLGYLGGRALQGGAYVGEQLGAVEPGSSETIGRVADEMGGHAARGFEQFVTQKPVFNAGYADMQAGQRDLAAVASPQNTVLGMSPKTVADVSTIAGGASDGALGAAMGRRLGGRLGASAADVSVGAGLPAVQNAIEQTRDVSPLSLTYEQQQLLPATQLESQIDAKVDAPNASPYEQHLEATKSTQQLVNRADRGNRAQAVREQMGLTQQPTPAQQPAPEQTAALQPPAANAPPQAWDEYAKAITDDPNTPINEKMDAIKPFVQQITVASGLPPEEVAKFVQQAETQGLQPSQMQEAFQTYAEQLAANNPEAMQQPGFIEQAFDSFSKMDGGTQALLGLGLGLGVIGLMNSARGGSGLSSVLMMLLGFGTSAFVGAQGGMFGPGAQDAVKGVGDTLGGMFGETEQTLPQPGLRQAWKDQLNNPNSDLVRRLQEGTQGGMGRVLGWIPGGDNIMRSQIAAKLQQELDITPQTAQAIASEYMQRQASPQPQANPGAGPAPNQTSLVRPAALDPYQTVRFAGNPNLPTA